MSIVVNDICERYRGDSTVGVAYIYCNFRRRDEQKLYDLLASLLKQLAAGQHTLSRIVHDLYNQHNKEHTRPSLEDITKALSLVVASYSKVFLLVDALDECQVVDGCRTRFLSEIITLQGNYDVHLLATSRFIPEIINDLKGSEVLKIHASGEDVRTYLDAQIFRLPNFVRRSVELQEDIKSAIVQSVQGMFLLAQLHLDSLVGKRSPKAVRTALQMLPTGSQAYDDAYKNAMERIEGQTVDQKELARQVLSWITYTKIPLTTLELQCALAVEVNTSEIDDSNFSEVEDMVSVCAGLVTVDEESDIIRLVHYTTQEYFERTQKQWFPDAEAMMTITCLTYLSFDVFQEGACQNDSDFEARLAWNTIYLYAGLNWGRHAREAPSTCPQVLEFLQRGKRIDASCQVLWSRKPWGTLHGYSQRFPKQMTGLHMAAYFGIETAFTSLLQQNDHVDLSDNHGFTPLLYAAQNGHEAIVKLLLVKAATVDKSDSHHRTPLSHAAQNGHEAIVRLLLANNASINCRDRFHDCTPLLSAVENEHVAIIELLLSNGAHVDSQRDDGSKSLHVAVKCWNKAMIRLLLENGAAINSKDRNGRTPLSYAAGSGPESVVQLLLDNGAEPYLVDCWGKTPLTYAAQKGHRAVAETLLSTGAGADIADICNREALIAAVICGNVAVVELFISKRVDLNDGYGFDPTPLTEVVKYGRVAIVELLISKGAVLDAVDQYGKTVLFEAITYHQTNILELLLSKGAATNVVDHCGWSPLFCAKLFRNDAMVTHLLRYGAADISNHDLEDMGING